MDRGVHICRRAMLFPKVKGQQYKCFSTNFLLSGQVRSGQVSEIVLIWFKVNKGKIKEEEV